LSHFQRLFLTDLAVARDAKVSIDNVPGKVADLKVGMRLELRLAADDLVVKGIDAFTPEKVKDCLVKDGLAKFVDGTGADWRNCDAGRGVIDRSTLGSMDFGVVGPERATSRSAVEPSREVGPTSRRRLARHNI
jgi:hypothetical protein